MISGNIKPGRLALIILGAVVLATGIWFLGVLYGPNGFGGAAGKTFTVSRGQTFTTIVDSLEAQGVIRSRPLFVFVARLFGGTNRIQVGRYVFPDGISNVDLFLSLREGKDIVLIPVTLAEGLRPRTQARILARILGTDSARFMQLVHDQEFAQSLGINAKSLEGYLLPETYKFYWQPDEREVITRLVEEFKGFYNDSMQARARQLGWTMNQVLTFASIVEGEAVLAEERPRISGVYHNRLRRGMPLQADPTIQYFIDGGPRRVLYSDLKINNPYNTYRNKGLPPGPVNNPGKASIMAALYPERHDFLYFVANGKGGHWFTSTYADHMRFVRQYRKIRDEAPRPITQAENTKGLKSN